MRGVGSPKLYYLKGIPSFEKLHHQSRTLSMVNFQIYPKGLVVRLSKSNKNTAVVILENEIVKVRFVSRRVKVRLRNWYYQYYDTTKHDAQLIFLLKNGELFSCYTSVSFYEATKQFFKKAWLMTKMDFELLKGEPIDGGEGKVGELQTNFTSQ